MRRVILVLLLAGFLIMGGEEKMGDGGAGAGDSGIGTVSTGEYGTLSEVEGVGGIFGGFGERNNPGVTAAEIAAANAGELASGTQATGKGATIEMPGEATGGVETIKPMKIEEPESPRPSGSRTGSGTESRKRRRSLLLEEEGGLLSPLNQAPVKRRSLFGT